MELGSTLDMDVESEREFLDSAIENMGRYLAKLLSTRCTAFIQRGNFQSLLKFETEFDDSEPYCRSCGAEVVDSLLCLGCRAIKPELKYGPTVVESMYRSSNSAYAIDEPKKRAILAIKSYMQLACDSIMLARALAQLCWVVHESSKQSSNPFLRNVLFDRDLIDAGGSYREVLLCGVTQQVRIGGFGQAVRDRVRELALEWLKLVDHKIRVWFEVPTARTDDDAASVASCQRQLARLVADRVALFDDPDCRQVDQCLSSEACDHIAALQHLRCKYFSVGSARNDMIALRTLLSIVQPDIDDATTMRLLEEHGIEVIKLLQTPPPELLKALPTLAMCYRFEALRDILSNDRTIDAIRLWKRSVNTSTLMLFLERAYSALNTWSLDGNLVRVVFCEDDLARQETGRAPRSSLCHRDARLPPAGWVSGGQRWFLIPKERYRAKRAGLDPTGLRIVLLVSVVNRMLFDEFQINEQETIDCSIFAPGRLAIDLLDPLAHAAIRKGSHAFGQLKEQLRPLTVGVEWANAQHDLVEWKGSHIDNDIRTAARHLSDYSVLQLQGLFGHGSVFHNQDGILMTRLLTTVREHLVVKPTRNYTEFVSAALRFALPLLREYRQSIGFHDHVRSSLVGDTLRLHPRIRDWNPVHGQLQLSAQDLVGLPKFVKDLIQELVAKNMVKKRRPRNSTRLMYCFSEPELLTVLGPRES
tara:strand:- start:1621 stop:3723 length:2103 start_codon:yes stop_codon:yes gene_type:complete